MCGPTAPCRPSLPRARPTCPSGYLPPEQTAAAAPEDGAEAASGQPQDGQPDTAGQEAGQEGTDAPLEGTTNEE